MLPNADNQYIAVQRGDPGPMSQTSYPSGSGISSMKGRIDNGSQNKFVNHNYKGNRVKASERQSSAG